MKPRIDVAQPEYGGAGADRRLHSLIAKHFKHRAQRYVDRGEVS